MWVFDGALEWTPPRYPVRGSPGLDGERAMKVLEVVRVGYGVAMMISPNLLLDQETGSGADATARRVVRVLGARHALQGVVLLAANEKWHRLGAVVDILHSASAVVFAATRPRWRRPAGASALVSLVFGAGEFR